MSARPLLRESASSADGELVLPNFSPCYAERGLAVSVCYRLSGPEGLPVVAVLGGISADADVMQRDDGAPGWWADQVGPGRGIDTRRYRILSFDYLTREAFDGSGCRALSSEDQANALAGLLAALDIDALHALIGVSYGAMVGLAFASRYPEYLQHLIAVSGAHRSHPFATALRGLQREIIRSGEASETSVALARALALTTYLTPDYFAKCFPKKAVLNDEGFHSEALSWLLYHGRKYASRTDARRYLDLSESLDLHQVAPESIATPTTLMAVDPDAVVPLAQMRELLGRLAGPARLHVVASPHGHDAFLKEHEAFRPLLRESLEGRCRHVA
jgi:homoserine O-acetyltransferase